MENLIPCKKHAMIFDLKGSLIDRLVNSNGTLNGVVLKDQNFLDSKMRVEIDSKQAKEIIENLKEDFYVLSKERIMDYSIIVCFYDIKVCTDTRYIVSYLDKYYSIGVIDILQKYNFAKISEKNFKALCGKDIAKMSVADPEYYFSRLSEFAEKIFRPPC